VRALTTRGRTVKGRLLTRRRWTLIALGLAVNASTLFLSAWAFSDAPPVEPPGGDPADSIAMLDAANGFERAAFGSALSSFEGMTLVEDPSGGWTRYVRSDDALTFGEARLSSLSYSFYDNHLGRVTLEAGGVDCERVLTELQRRYGEGVRQNESLEET